jgi:signal peptidase I
MSADHLRPRRAVRRARRLAGAAVVLLLVALWVVFLLPAGLRGTASYLIVSGNSMDDTYASGDLVIVRESGAYGVGDVIGYQVPEGEPGAGHLVIHRIVGGDPEQGFVTQGDNNDQPDLWRPRPQDVLGRSFLHLPGTGPLLIRLRTPVGLGLLAGLLSFTLLLDPRRPPAPAPVPATDAPELV